MADITAIILTRNEEKNIAECIQSIRLVNSSIRIIVIDSFSEDKTKEIAGQEGAEVYQHAFENHGKQWQWAMDAVGVQTTWVMRVDADERFLPASAAELAAFLLSDEEKKYNGIIFRYNVFFMGKLLKYGACAKFSKVTCYRVGAGHVRTDNMHDHFIADGGCYYTLKNKLDHKDYKDLSVWIAKHNWYATGEAIFSLQHQAIVEADGDKGAKIRAVLKRFVYDLLPSRIRTSLAFFIKYYLGAGFLNGREGYLYCYFQYKWYRTLVDAKIFEFQETQSMPENMGAL